MENNKMRFCVECGSPLLQGAKFCIKCGSMVNEEVVPVQKVTTPDLVENIRRKKSSIALWCVFGVLLVLALVVWGFVFADVTGVLQRGNEAVEENEDDTERSRNTREEDDIEELEEEESFETEVTVAETVVEEALDQEDTILVKETLTDCRQAYKTFLEEYEAEYERFGLAYIDEDDIPELLIFKGDAHAHGADIYSFWGNAVTYAGTMGGYGGFHYSEKDNLIVHSDGHMGVFYELYSGLENGVLTEYESLNGEEVIDPDTFEIIGYDHYINDAKVTEEEYLKKSEELSAGLELTSRYYETSYPITQAFIDQVFTNEKEWMKKEVYIDVETEVEQIREWYYETQNNIDSYEKEWHGEVCAYRGSYTIDKVVTSVGVYTHESYYHYGELYFVFVFDGSEEHRYYYKNGLLIRYVDPDGMTLDWENLESVQLAGDEIKECASEAYSLCLDFEE